MKQPSVIIPVFNCFSLTRQCLDLLVEEIDNEIVVVDDGSSDETSTMLEAYADRIRVVRHPRNLGFAASCNDGAAVASGDSYVFLNNDTIPHPGWLDALLRHARSHPEADIIGGKLLYPDGTVQHCGVVICEDRYPRHIYTGFSGDHAVASRSRPFQIVTGACMLVRKSVFEQAGGFDTAFQNGFEDVDFCLRARQAGSEIHYCSECEVVHLESVSPGRFAHDAANVALYRKRWIHRVAPDELRYYVQDGLIRISHEGHYPVHLEVSPLLATLSQNGQTNETSKLLRRRSRQIADYLKENTRLRLEIANHARPSKSLEYHRLRLQIQRRVRTAVPGGSKVLFISKGDQSLVDIEGYQGWHFPMAENGAYAGFHPADSDEAITHLDELIARGADHLVIPATAYWWFEHYSEFKAYLERNGTTVAAADDCCIYRLPYAKRTRRPRHRLHRQTRDLPGPAAPAKMNGSGPTRKNVKHSASGAPKPTIAVHYSDVVSAIQHTVNEKLPAHSVVSVISKGDDNLIRFRTSRGWHFPKTPQGVFAGFYPESAADAIEHLKSQRNEGAEYLVIPVTSSWWLDHYTALREYLEQNCQTEHQSDLCTVYKLRDRSSTSLWRRTCSRLSAQLKGLGRRRRKDSSPEQLTVSDPDNAAAQLHPDRRPLDPGLITVIVPIYNAYDDVKRCLTALIRHRRPAHQFLLIDDCSSDSRIWPLLQSVAEPHPQFRVIRNEENLGFTRTINRGCQLAPGDVVLLNSDTQVTAGWLEKLDACASTSQKVGTVTPLSNAAGAFSVPKNNTVNEIPASMTVDEVGNLLESLSERVRPRVPTGNGFCMFISRNVLNVNGYFDAVHFPRGYGEENDFCMRATKKGFINLIDDATFIHHQRSASFGENKAKLIAENSRTLRELHPTYKQEVTQWLQNDPLDSLREKLASHLQADRPSAPPDLSDRPCLLYVIHDGKGGTPLTNADLIQGIAGEFRCLLLTTGLNQWRLSEAHEGSFRPLRKYRLTKQWRLTDPMDEERIGVLEEIRRRHHINLVHVRHLLGSGPELVRFFRRNTIPVVFSFHDYYTVCPTIQLIDHDGTYCRGKCTSGSEDCKLAPSWFRGERPRLKHDYVLQHQKKMKQAIRHSDVLITTCHSAGHVVEQVFPEAKKKRIQIIEHGRDIQRENLAVPPTKTTPARVACLGNIDRAKGSEVIIQLMHLNQSQGSPFEFHFLGRHASIFKPEESGGINHGAYERDQLSTRIRSIQPSFSLIASIWPETYCHTLTESWGLGIPVFASHFGALKERVEQHGGGWLIDPADPEACFRTMLEIRNSPDRYAEALEAIGRMPERSTADMVRDYRRIYAQCLNTK